MFLDSRKLAEFETQSGKPKTECTMMNINTVTTTIEEDHHQSVQALTEELKIIWNRPHALHLLHSSTACKNSGLVGVSTTCVTKPAVSWLLFEQ